MTDPANVAAVQVCIFTIVLCGCSASAVLGVMIGYLLCRLDVAKSRLADAEKEEKRAH